MQLYLKTILAIALVSAVCTAQATERPNVILIISDDQTWTDYGFMNHPHVQTPHLDRLASQSLVYERGYVTAPLCRPSLASLVTGLYPHQNRIRGNDPVLPGGIKRVHAPELFVEWRPRMSAPMDSLPSMVRILRKFGGLTPPEGTA